MAERWTRAQFEEYMTPKLKDRSWLAVVACHEDHEGSVECHGWRTASLDVLEDAVEFGENTAEEVAEAREQLMRRTGA